MEYYISAPAEVALLGRWGLQSTDTASLYGTLSIRQSMLAAKSCGGKSLNFGSSLDIGLAFVNYGIKCPLNLKAVISQYVEHGHYSVAVDRNVLGFELPDIERGRRSYAILHGGLIYSRSVNSYSHLDMGLGDYIVAVDLAEYYWPVDLPVRKLSYLNELAASFDPHSLNVDQAAQLGELLDLQHRVIAEHIPKASQFCEIYNELRLMGALGCRCVGTLMFCIVKPEVLSSFIELVNSSKTIPGGFASSVKFSSRGIDIRKLS